MPSETFFCPGCKNQLTKSARHYVLGETMGSSTTFISMGRPAESVRCPACGIAIDVEKMVRGDYDGARRGGIISSTFELLFLLAFLIAVVVGISALVD